MFRRLRNILLLINLVSITVLMVASFFTIYFVTSANIWTDIRDDLRRVSSLARRPFPDGAGSSPQPERSILPGDPVDLPPDRFDPPPERLVSFTLQTSRGGVVLDVRSTLDLDADLYSDAANAALDRERPEGEILLDGSRWAFFAEPSPNGNQITFLDISSRTAILRQLVFTFLPVGGTTLLLIFLVSKFFAEHAIRPVRESFERQKRFVADASHELRTPLAVISANVDVLLAKADATEEERVRWLDYIKAETDRMTQLTNDLLFLAQLDQAAEASAFGTVDLGLLAEHVTLTMDAVAFERGHAFETRLTSGALVRGDEEKLRRLVVILLDNALKYASPGAAINVSVDRRHSECVLSVSNPGEGIPPEHIDRLFDRFYRADTARTGGGSYGLGLAIADSIVEEHRGRISAESSPDGVTKFRVVLPG